MDPRNIGNGWQIPSEGYCDQPYVIQADDGHWLCCMTTGRGKEGERGQHVVAIRSADFGRSWSAPIDIEPADGPEASYSVLFKTPNGRIYCFYNYNHENIREVVADQDTFTDGICRRVDSLGQFVFKFSDDSGVTWSRSRYPIPVRDFIIDRSNPYRGKVRFGWNVGKPFVLDGAVYVTFHKVGGFGKGFFTRSEGVLLRSENLLNAQDPSEIKWQTLPDGDVGLHAPEGGGPVAEEHSCVVLSCGSICAIYRTISGHAATSCSKDRGFTWTTPEYLRYADERPIKNPRAANFAWKCSNGKYLYWFHNNGWNGYNFGQGAGSRNVAWLSGGIERHGRIKWSQPEIILYDPDQFSGPSYPDLIEESGRYFLAETQKTVARVHELNADLLQGLWNQFEPSNVTRNGLLLDLSEDIPGEIGIPDLPEFATRDYWTLGPGQHELGGGFTLDLCVRFDSLNSGQAVLDNRTAEGVGFALTVTDRGTVELRLHDGRSAHGWESDPGALMAGRNHRLTVIVDGGPKVILFMIDGRLCDGAGHRMYGWGRFSPAFRGATGARTLRIASTLHGKIQGLRIYARAISVSEAYGNWNAEKVRITSGQREKELAS